ncbi:hypothetical protein OEB99_05180 [Actinotalea sp. M2MS4P-6]|uniref:MTH938/NDUFAF3 family protein n=1 Tax=Actinotalea sp. M2MS4P-6 TaxID=2983762 RepID=UPI0021E5000C|nr:MTH938/NDUFAF3 family protein [Actinotalea sp. M2MS4P-6]MCV2393695.1 hypothetical protein [Actinotalea sp. M2MS4P-6]
MKARLLGFGEIEIDGQVYPHDVVIDAGVVRRRSKKASKPLRAQYGHTPLSPAEGLPWGGTTLIVGTGVDGALPIVPEVVDEAARRGVRVVAVPTEEACRLLDGLEDPAVNAVLHVTC